MSHFQYAPFHLFSFHLLSFFPSRRSLYFSMTSRSFGKQLVFLFSAFLLLSLATITTASCASCCGGGVCHTAFRGSSGMCCGAIDIDEEWVTPYCCPDNSRCVRIPDANNSTITRSFKCELVRSMFSGDSSTLGPAAVPSVTTTAPPTLVSRIQVITDNKWHLFWVIPLALLIGALCIYAIYRLAKVCCPTMLTPEALDFLDGEERPSERAKRGEIALASRRDVRSQAYSARPGTVSSVDRGDAAMAAHHEYNRNHGRSRRGEDSDDDSYGRNSAALRISSPLELHNESSYNPRPASHTHSRDHSHGPIRDGRDVRREDTPSRSTSHASGSYEAHYSGQKAPDTDSISHKSEEHEHGHEHDDYRGDSGHNEFYTGHHGDSENRSALDSRVTNNTRTNRTNRNK